MNTPEQVEFVVSDLAKSLKANARWTMISGIVILVLGIMLWRQFPLSGAWAIGILFGAKLIISGWTFVFMGRSVKKTVAESHAV